MNYWITGIITLLVGIFGSTGFWMLIQKRMESKSMERQIILSVTYLGVKMSCKAILERGYADPEEIEDLERYLYEPYRAMGGNGTAELFMDKVKSLPTRREIKHERLENMD